MRKLFKLVLWLSGILAVLLIILQIVLSHPVMTGLVNRYAGESVGGYVHCDKASVSMIRSFPEIDVELKNFSYIHPEDTTALSGMTASFRRFSASLRVLSLIQGRLHVPEIVLDSMSISMPLIIDGKADDFTVPVSVNGAFTYFLEEGSFDADGNILMGRCNFRNIIDSYAAGLVPELKSFSTDLYLGADMDFKVSSHQRILADAKLNKLTLDAPGLGIAIKGKADDITGEDPLLSVDAQLSATLDSLVAFLPDSLEIEAAGKIKARINGDARLSQLNVYNFSNSSLTGEITAEAITVNMPVDTIKADIDSLKILLGPEEIASRRDSTKTMHLMGVTGTMAKADISYKSILKLTTEDFLISAKNSLDSEITLDTLNMHPFTGRIAARKLFLRDSEGTSLRLNNSSNSFRIMPKRGQTEVPMLTLTSRNERIHLRSQYNRVSLTNADLRASAAMNSVERRMKAKAFMDSLARMYPDVPKDSLFRYLMTRRTVADVALPSWLQEEDFNKQDINISLDKTLAKYFREWDINGGLSVRKGMVMSPYFPLRNILGGFDLKFTNDDIAINKFAVKSGDSNISATGRLSGLKKALLGRKGALRLNVDITSEGVDANQLLTAYASGMNFNPENFTGNSEEITDEQFMEQVVIDTASIQTVSPLIVVPANLIADIKVNASKIKYSDLLISKATANLTMKERCVRITDTKALTNMGDISVEGFYSTRTKKDIKTGFSLNFKDITAEKVIDLMPAIDTVMPLLKSFGGMLNCEIAATAQLDTSMNILMPTINGVMRIGGENLTVSDNEMFKKLARVLMFRNKKKGQIDKMTVEGIIKDCRMEIFPFILEMDRYMLGLSGVQNMDMSFRYHASLIKSPLLIKLGMDVYGQDFDHMKFKLGRAKYKSRNVPVFSDVIDDTKINLVESIRNIYDRGIDAVMSENGRMRAIEERRKKIGYVQAVDQKLEELSADEQAKLEEEGGKEEVELENNTKNE